MVNCDFKPFTKIHYQCIVHDHKLRRMSQTVKHLWFYSMYMIMIYFYADPMQYIWFPSCRFPVQNMTMDYNRIDRQSS